MSALYTANWRILFWLSYTTFLIRTQFWCFFGRFEDSKRTFWNKSTFISNRIYLKSRTLRMNQGCISLKLLSYKKSTKMNVLPTNLMKSWKKCTNRRSKSFKKEKKILKDFKQCLKKKFINIFFHILLIISEKNHCYFNMV